MVDFQYHCPTKIYFGKNSLNNLTEAAAVLGKQVLLLYGQSSAVKSGLVEKCRSALAAADAEVFVRGGVKPNPSLEFAYGLIDFARANNITGILAVGGGSVIDTAKAVGMGAVYDGDVWDFFTRGKQPPASLPVGTVLTIAAAGSESSPNCVLTDERTGKKRGSIKSDAVRPLFSVLDPTLTFTLPAYQTACGVCDINAHVLERYFTPERDVILTDFFCEGILKTVIHYAPLAIAEPNSYAARAEIMLAGMYAHNDIAGVGRVQDWVSHGLAHEVSALNDTAHGAALSVIFPAWMRYVCRTHPKPFEKFARNIFGLAEATEGIAAYEAFTKSLGLPVRLAEIGITESDIPKMVANFSEFPARGALLKIDAAGAETIFRLAL